MSEYMDYIEKLKSDINYQINQKHEYILQNEKLKNELLRVGEMEDYWDIKSSKLEEENERKDKLIKALKASESNLWHSSREFEDENTELKEVINNFREQNFELREDLGTYKNQYNKIIKENRKLKQRISNLVSENTNLQNDLFSEQLLQDEKDDYIDRLKNELFNAYLTHKNKLIYDEDWTTLKQYINDY